MRRIRLWPGPGGTGLNDYYSPEVDSAVVPLPGVKTLEGASCAPIRDTVGIVSVEQQLRKHPVL